MGDRSREVAIVEALRAAREAWGALALDEAELSRWVEARAPDAAAIEKLKIADLALACACASGERRALDVFEEKVLAPAVGALLRAGATKDEADEAKQGLFERLFLQGKISEHGARGSFGGWVNVALARVR